MKKFFIVGLVTMVTLMASAVKPDADFIEALIMVESGGCSYAIGDGGNAVGCLQISKSVVDDVNQVSSVKYSYMDRYNVAKSKEMCRIYLNRYATRKRLGHDPTYEDMARIWNGGPNGYKKPATIKYWNKVKSIM